MRSNILSYTIHEWGPAYLFVSTPVQATSIWSFVAPECSLYTMFLQWISTLQSIVRLVLCRFFNWVLFEIARHANLGKVCQILKTIPAVWLLLATVTIAILVVKSNWFCSLLLLLLRWCPRREDSLGRRYGWSHSCSYAYAFFSKLCSALLI